MGDQDHVWNRIWAAAEAGGDCLPNAPTAAKRVLHDAWESFARSLDHEAAVLDIGTGNGAVLRTLHQVRPDLFLTGIDVADTLSESKGYELLGGVDASSIPTQDDCFAAVVSQFGMEYCGREAIGEIGRVAAPHAVLLLLMHHRDSLVVRAAQSRACALEAINASKAIEGMARGGTTFSDGKRMLYGIFLDHQRHPVIEDLAGALDLAKRDDRLAEECERLEQLIQADLTAIRTMQDVALDEAALSAFMLSLQPDWADLSATPVQIDGEPFPLCWKVEGVRRGKPCG